MKTKNIRLINAEEVSHLFQTKYDNSSFIRVISGEQKIDLATSSYCTNEVVEGDKLEIKIGSSYVIELDDYSSEIELELKNLGWGLILFINKEAYYFRSDRLAFETEFISIKNYTALKIVDFGSGKNLAIKNLDCLSELKQVQILNVNNCPSLADLKGLVNLTTIETLFLDGFSLENELQYLAYLNSLYNLYQNDSAIKDLKHIKNIKSLNALYLSDCKSLTSVEGISGLTNLTKLDLTSCVSLTNLDGISSLTNLTTLMLGGCELLKSLDGVSSLIKLTTLNLNYCSSLVDINSISDLKNLKFLNLGDCDSILEINSLSSLKNLKWLNLNHTGLYNDVKSCWDLNLSPIKELKNLTYLTIRSNSLINVDDLSELVNLKTLIFTGCKCLRNINSLSYLINLETLEFTNCKSLSDINVLSSLNKLSTLDLGWTSVNNLDCFKNLTNLKSLILYGCYSLLDFEGLSELKNLNYLDISGNKFKNVNFLMNLTNLKTLDLSGCDFLINIEGISSAISLTSLNLIGCNSIISIKKIKKLPKLNQIKLDDCSNIRDFEELIHCPNLKVVTWIHDASCSYVLTGSAVRRKDSLLIEEKIEGWINDLQFSKDHISFANELIAAVSLIENETIAKVQFIHHAQAMRERGLADGDSGNAFCVTTWELWVEAVMKQTEVFQEIVELSIQNINAAREIEVVLSPIISALADVPIQSPNAKSWALNFVEQQLELVVSNEDWARTIAPAAAVFYAGFELQEKVLFWLNKGTHPHLPKWRDTILLALVIYFAKKEEYVNARKYLNEIVLTDIQDQARVELAQSMCVHLPQEALEQFSSIQDLVLQTAVAQRFSIEPSILSSSDGIYQLLLCLEQTPELFSEFVANILEKQPNTQFVQSIEALFSKPVESNGISNEFISLCENPEVLQFVAQRKIDKLKQELQDGSIEERALLLNSFIALLVDKKILDVEESKELQLTLTTKR
jgi:Leucine-rich repeat (LRR) protein